MRSKPARHTFSFHLLSPTDISFRVNKKSEADKIRLEKVVISSSHTQQAKPTRENKKRTRKNFISKNGKNVSVAPSEFFRNLAGSFLSSQEPSTNRIAKEEKRNSHKITMGNLKDIERITKSCISSFISTSYTHTSNFIYIFFIVPSTSCALWRWHNSAIVKVFFSLSFLETKQHNVVRLIHISLLLCGLKVYGELNNRRAREKLPQKRFSLKKISFEIRTNMEWFHQPTFSCVHLFTEHFFLRRLRRQ